jgi:hypothetical protein
MQRLMMLLLAISFLALSGCGGRQSKGRAPASTDRAEQQEAARPQASQPVELDAESALNASMMTTIGGRNDQFADNAQGAQTSANAMDRKIIRNGELALETDSPTDGLRRITAIAESLGGFVVTSEFKQTSSNQSSANQNVTIVARVPSTQFSAALEHIRSVGSHVIQEKVSGQDVSEEYLDLEARIRTKKALEAQFLEIMKQAHKVSDALEVQSQIAEVRTEIERYEGRRRFLENQSALSTITITLQMPAPLVAATTTGFGQSIKATFGDAIDIAASIVLGLIKFIIVLTPIAIIFGIPAWLVWRTVRRRLPKKSEPVAEPQ